MAFYDGSQRAIEANDMTFAQVSKMCKADEITIRFTNHHLGYRFATLLRTSCSNSHK